MALNIFQFRNGLQIIPVSSSTINEQGELEVLTTDTKLQYHNGTSKSPVVTESHASQGVNRLQNKDLEDLTLAIVDSSDITKKILFDASGTTGTSTTLQSSQTSNQIITLPDTTDTLVGKATTDILTNKTISGLTNTFSNIANANLSNMAAHTFKANNTGSSAAPLDITATQATAELVNFVGDSGSGGTKGLVPAPASGDAAAGKFLKADGTWTNVSGGGVVTDTGAATLSNKNLVDNSTFIVDVGDNTKRINLDAAGATGTTMTVRAVQTTNKILTLPDITDTLIARNTTDILTNKTLKSDTVEFIDPIFSNRHLKFDPSGQSAITTTTIATLGSTTQTVFIPNVPGNDTIVMEALAQIITNKDIDGGTASNTHRITFPKNTKTNLDGLTRKEGTTWYSTDQKKLFFDDGTQLNEVGTGSGQGGINYILNPDPEVNTDSWATYADAAGSTPVNGTGGSPNVTFTRNTSSPLRGQADFQLSKDAANRQGQGVSYDFTIDNADKNTQFKIEFDYSTTANFIAGASSDVRVFIYDITNATLIIPTRTTLTTGAGTYVSSFYASSSTSYRLIFHIATTSALAYDLHLDRVSVGPALNSILTGPSISDFQSFTMNITGSTSDPAKGTTTVDNAQWCRVGDSMEIIWDYIQTGAGSAGSGTYLFNLPSGYLIDSNKVKVSTTAADASVVGHGSFNNSTDKTLDIELLAYSTSALSARYNTSDQYTNIVGSTVPLSTANWRISFFLKVPIANWTSNSAIANSGIIRISEVLSNGTRITGSAPTSLGQYRSYLRNANTQTYTETNGAPTATPSVADGIKLYGNPSGFTAADSNNNPSKYDIFVGKYKSVSPQYYLTTGKTGNVSIDLFASTSNSIQSGSLFTYDPTTGIATIVVPPYAAAATEMNAGIDTNGARIQDIYFDINIADNDYQIQLAQTQSEVSLYLANGYGSTNTAIRRFTNIDRNIGTAITYADSATLGATFTINEGGIYSIHSVDQFNTSQTLGISLNTTQPTIDIQSLTNTRELLAGVQTSAANIPSEASITIHLNPGDIIRAHTAGQASGVATWAEKFRICKVSN